MTYRNRQQAGGWGLWALLHTSTHGASAPGPPPIQAVRVTGRPESLTYQKKNQNPLGIHKGKEAQPSCTGFWKGRMRPRKRNHRTSLATFQPESFRETKGSSSHTHTHISMTSYNQRSFSNLLAILMLTPWKKSYDQPR